MSTKFRPATAEEYVAWLRGYLATGGRIRYYYDYPFERMRCLIATDDFALAGECGANARTIIVPAGIRAHGPLGHNQLLFTANWEIRGVGGAAVFTNPIFHDLPGYWDAKGEDDAERIRTLREERRLQADHDWARDNTDLGAYTAREKPTPGVYRASATSNTADVYVEDGTVVLHPSSLPLIMTPEAANDLIEQLRAAVTGARTNRR